jgi:hypothetical protein
LPFVSSFGVFKAHCLEIIPAGRIVRHGDPVLIAQDDAGPVEDTPDRRIELARGFWLGLPNNAERRGHVYRRNFVSGTIEQFLAIGVTEVAFPLMAGFRADGFAYRVLNDAFGDLPEGRDRLRGVPGGSVGFDRVNPAGDEFPCLAGSLPSILEADCGIGASPLVLSDAGDLIPQHPFLAPSPAHNEVEASPSLCRPGFAVCTPSSVSRAILGPTSGPTLRSGLSHTAADSGRRDPEKTPGFA